MCRFLLLVLAFCGALYGSLAFAADISFVNRTNIDGNGNHAVDVFYTPTTGLDFIFWDFIVAPIAGRVLDPLLENRSDDITDGAAVDTWANSVVSSLGGPTPTHSIFASSEVCVGEFSFR